MGSLAGNSSSEVEGDSQLLAPAPYSCPYAITLHKASALSAGMALAGCCSAFVFRDVVGVRFLTELSICGLSISHLPPEIGHLRSLVKLDLSSNKLRQLPETVSLLSALRYLTAAGNRLTDLPPSICRLQRLERLDLSNNRLSSFGAFDLSSMPALRCLNIQENKLAPVHSQAPSSSCYLEGKNGYLIEDGSFSQSGMISDMDAHSVSSVDSSVDNVSSRLHVPRRPLKGSKNHDSLQQKARQERLNYRRSFRASGSNSNQRMYTNACVSTTDGNQNSELHSDAGEELADAFGKPFHSLGHQLGALEDSVTQVSNFCESGSTCQASEKCAETRDIGNIMSEFSTSFSCISTEITQLESTGNDFEDDADSSSVSYLKTGRKFDESSSKKVLGTASRLKRHSIDDLSNPKPRKSSKLADECLDLSFKYSTESFCNSNTSLPDGFFDAGRSRPFLFVQNQDECHFLDSREVIVLDRRKDEDLDAILLSARQLLLRLKTSSDSPTKEHLVANDFQRASVLALFVSDIFGGSDRSSMLLKMRKAASGSNMQQPFVCTCSGINNNDSRHYRLAELCENSLRMIKETRNSNIIPLGALRLGICRHRSLLMKYLCDRMDPPIPCELVRGYLDYMPHAWNVIVQQGQSEIRMVVDTCYPTDIRVETDPEYFCRYIPLSRCLVPLTPDDSSPGCSFPSVSLHSKTDKGSCHTVRHCSFGTVDAAAKMKYLDLTNASLDDVKMFEYSFLGEVRILGALRNHRCIVEIYGHQLSSKCIASANGLKEKHVTNSMIIMEYVKGGSLKNYLEELSLKKAKHVPVGLAMHIAREVAHALVEVHSKHIIHRDIKSENILIDLESKMIDGSPIVKLSDFDRAVPVQSFLHTCCIAHLGVHPPNTCVGTPRWMAPEVLRAIEGRSPYGIEVDIWSYGCLLFELLTLKMPYDGFLDSELYNLICMGQRPRLAPELEELVSFDRLDPGSYISSADYSDSEKRKLNLLIQLFYQCTCHHPADRPTAMQIYKLICDADPGFKEL